MSENTETIRVIKVTTVIAGKPGASYVASRESLDATFEEIERLLDKGECRPGEAVRCEAVDMLKKDFDALPDFEGF